MPLCSTPWNFTPLFFSQDGITRVRWREYKGNIPTVSTCVEELRNAQQACFVCLGELSSPLSAKYHQKNDDADPTSAANGSTMSGKSISKLENDILHLYVFSWTPESMNTQTAILDRFVSVPDPSSQATNEPTPSNKLECAFTKFLAKNTLFKPWLTHSLFYLYFSP